MQPIFHTDKFHRKYNYCHMSSSDYYKLLELGEGNSCTESHTCSWVHYNSYYTNVELEKR